MSSLREQILSRIAAVITAAAPGGAVAYRSREVSLTRALSPAIILMPQNNALSRVATGVDVNQFEVAMEIVVRGDPWESLADPIDVAAHALVMNDATLWALISDVRRISESFESLEADRTAGTLTAHYRITYRTSALDITRIA